MKINMFDEESGLLESKKLLEQYLWEDPQTSKTEWVTLFPENGFGKFILERSDLIKIVRDEINRQRSLRRDDNQSVFLSGCRGMGKTVSLHLIARDLKKRGYEVYFFEDPRLISFDALVSMLKSKLSKVAFLIDEVACDRNSPIFNKLLKAPSQPNLVTIGAAVSCQTNHPSGVLRASELAFKESHEDFQRLVNYFVSQEVATPQMTRFICKFLLTFCGGHAYPSLALMEYFLLQTPQPNLLESESKFCTYFHGPIFMRGDFFQLVMERCFDSIADHKTRSRASRVFMGKSKSKFENDIKSLTRLGWWNEETNHFLSPFLVNVCLNAVRTATSDLHLKDMTPGENELMIVEGLFAMEESDFKCSVHDSGVRVEDGLAFNWATKTKIKVPNAFLSFQERSLNGRVDFYLNGDADCAIEILLNATQTGSQDIDQHLERFLNGKYHYWKRYVLFNFAMTRNEVVLPRKHEHHGKVYTSVHSSNELYCGRRVIKSPAVGSLPCPKPLFTDQEERDKGNEEENDGRETKPTNEIHKTEKFVEEEGMEEKPIVEKKKKKMKKPIEEKLSEIVRNGDSVDKKRYVEHEIEASIEKEKKKKKEKWNKEEVVS